MLYVQSPGTVSIHPGLSLTKGTNPGTKSNNWLVFVQNSLNLHLVVVVSSICSCGSGWPGPLCVCHKNRRLVKILPEAVGGWCWWTGWLVQVTLVWLAACPALLLPYLHLFIRFVPSPSPTHSNHFLHISLVTHPQTSSSTPLLLAGSSAHLVGCYHQSSLD